MTKNIIAEVYHKTKSGVPVEDAIPDGADVRMWRRLLASYNPAAKPKVKRKNHTYRSNRKRSRRSGYSRMQSVINGATLKLVERVNGNGHQETEQGAAIPDDLITINTGDYTAKVNRNTGEVSYADNR